MRIYLPRERETEMIEIIITFGAHTDFKLSDDEIPTDIQKRFGQDELIEAAEYYMSAVGYFRQALEFDSRFRGLGINVHFWDGNVQRAMERLR